MNNLYYLLLEIRKDPYKYLERPTLKYLYTFMSGYIVYMNYINQEVDLAFYQDFQKFIEHKYQINLSMHHTDIIEFYCMDEGEAFDKYFELLDEYITSQK